MTKDKSIFIKNIYYMLSYAFTTLHRLADDRIATEKFENMHNLFAAILSIGIGCQLKQGLYREYMNRTEYLPMMRGKIDMPGTIKNMVRKRQRLACEFDEVSEDNLLNQILKTTVMLLLRHGEVDLDHKNDLKKMMLFFHNVSEIDPVRIKWSTIRFWRNNQSYQVLMGICQLIVEEMLLTTDDGEYKLATFVDDQGMARLFEKFILEYYRKEHPRLKVSASQIPWALDNGVGTLLPVMQSDVMLENLSGDTVLIIDAKYYAHMLAENRFNGRTLHSANLYQIFTYVKNKEVDLGAGEHSVSGMLLYAGTDEELQPNISYQMSGNKISVRTLDLNKEFSEIARQLDDLVAEHFGGERGLKYSGKMILSDLHCSDHAPESCSPVKGKR